MSVDKFESAGATVDDELTDFQALMARIKADRPGVRDASEDISALQEVLDRLIEMRREAKLSQKDLARRMGVKQPTVSQFETESSDPRISTLQRYARAVGTCLRISVGPQIAFHTYGTRDFNGKSFDVWYAGDDLQGCMTYKARGYEPSTVGAAETNSPLLPSVDNDAADYSRADLAFAG